MIDLYVHAWDHLGCPGYHGASGYFVCALFGFEDHDSEGGAARRKYLRQKVLPHYEQKPLDFFQVRRIVLENFDEFLANITEKSIRFSYAKGVANG